MSDIENSTFHLQLLGCFPHYFSDDERDALNRWGGYASGLTDGSIEPTSAREKQFVAVARGTCPPATRFQRVWLRYLQALNMEALWKASKVNLSIATRRLDTANSQIEQLQEDVIRLTKLWKFARESGETQKPQYSKDREPSALQETPIQTRVDVSLSPSTESSNVRFVRDVSNHDEYLQFIGKGLNDLSDNDVFILFNMVDDLALTPEEASDLNREHIRRARRYRAREDIAGETWDWRDQNEAK